MENRKMALGVFAFHVSCLATDTGEFTLCPSYTRAYKVEIEPSKLGKPWDTVRINGQYCGNRQGAIAEFSRMVWEECQEKGIEIVLST